MNLSADTLTGIAHTLIMIIGVAAYWRASQVKALVEIQKETINTLQIAFNECKSRLDDLQKRIEE